jgi:hypothetical protein
MMSRTKSEVESVFRYHRDEAVQAYHCGTVSDSDLVARLKALKTAEAQIMETLGALERWPPKPVDLAPVMEAR